MTAKEIQTLEKDAARYRFLRAIDYSQTFEIKRALKVAVTCGRRAVDKGFYSQNLKTVTMIHPCKCKNGFHRGCDGRPKCRARNSKQFGLKLVFK